MITEVLIIIDESGSMASRRQDVIGGFNTYIEELRKDKANEYRITLTKFSDLERVLYTSKPVSEIPTFEYTPGGGTALYDAIGQTIINIKNHNSEDFCVQCGTKSFSYNYCPTCGRKLQIGTGAGKYLVVIMTDGEENSSRLYRKHHVMQMIKDKEALGNWTFIYLGANQNAMKEGSAIGIPVGNTYTYGVQNTPWVFSNLASSTVGYATSNAAASINYINDFAGGSLEFGSPIQPTSGISKANLTQGNLPSGNLTIQGTITPGNTSVPSTKPTRKRRPRKTDIV